jgi:hypothetical protein
MVATERRKLRSPKRTLVEAAIFKVDLGSKEKRSAAKKRLRANMKPIVQTRSGM